MRRIVFCIVYSIAGLCTAADNGGNGGMQPMKIVSPAYDEKPAIGIDFEARTTVAGYLNSLLADEHVLFTKLFKYHWNVRGMSFGPLHSLFQEQYEILFKFIDGIAERIRALGLLPDGALETFIKKSSLTEQPGFNPSAREMVLDLLNDHEAIIRILRDLVDKTAEKGDMGTSNFVNDLLEKHEKMAWMLRAHVAVEDVK